MWSNKWDQPKIDHIADLTSYPMTIYPICSVFGSFLKQIKLDKGISYFKNFWIRKNCGVKVDRNGQRCSNDQQQDTVGHCIVRYLEDKYNCTAYLLMANRFKPFCNKEIMGGMVTWLDSVFKHMSEADIYNQTGCLPLCERDEISLDDAPGHTW